MLKDGLSLVYRDDWPIFRKILNTSHYLAGVVLNKICTEVPPRSSLSAHRVDDNSALFLQSLAPPESRLAGLKSEQLNKG